MWDFGLFIEQDIQKRIHYFVIIGCLYIYACLKIWLFRKIRISTSTGE